MDKQKVNKISLLTVQNVKLQNKTEKKISTAKRKSRVEEIQGVEGEQGDGGDSRKRWRKRQKWRFKEKKKEKRVKEEIRESFVFSRKQKRKMTTLDQIGEKIFKFNIR